LKDRNLTTENVSATRHLDIMLIVFQSVCGLCWLIMHLHTNFQQNQTIRGGVIVTVIFQSVCNPPSCILPEVNFHNSCIRRMRMQIAR